MVIRIGLGMDLAFALLLALASVFAAVGQDRAPATEETDIVESDPKAAAELENKLVSNARQLTFAGRRAGEGYFSRDGQRLILQAEQEPQNPFYQIYTLDLGTGDMSLVSPGTGKTTCAWFHPDGKKALFASTHEDSQAVAKQQAEIDFRNSGRERRYSWDYDPTFELYEVDLGQPDSAKRLTNAEGYDAEGSYSPDGRYIAFSSNRNAYGRTLTEREQKQLEIDPAFFCDLFLLDLQTGDLKQLTDVPGYDGGPFFSPDGQRICWRRFSEDGVQAEVFTMRLDGTDVQQLTRLGAMSWAPFYHPSGEYVIFATNRHGFGNFELYLARADGEGEPLRVTYTAGFDGLPCISPDGTQLAWTSNRTANKQSQIFLGQWNHAAARAALGLTSLDGDQARRSAREAMAATAPSFQASDIGRHVDYLCRPELEGRMTGSDGERLATNYFASYLESLGFEPAAPDGGWFHEFEFPAGAELVAGNRLGDGTAEYELDQQWRPLAFSATGGFASSPVVFAGYGLVAPAENEFEEYDSYVHLDVADKWVVVFRDLPQDISSEKRQHWARFSGTRRKAMEARDRGARGIIFVTGPRSPLKKQLISFGEDASQAGSSIAVISINDELAQSWLASSGKLLEEIQQSLDSGAPQMGFELPEVQLSGNIEIERKKGIGRNVIGRLRGGDEISEQALLIGAHIDHLGKGLGRSGSLARDDERELIHFGADDNASGVAALLEIAQYLAAEKKAGRLNMQRDLLIAAWSGEEMGLFGSEAYARTLASAMSASAPKDDVHAQLFTADGPLYPYVSAYLNLDMVGRLREKLVVQGLASSSAWNAIVQQRNVPVGLTLQLDPASSNLPTDAATFFKRGVPILSAFTGAHEEYHTPRDQPHLLNYEGASKIAQLFALVARGLLQEKQPPLFDPSEEPVQQTVPRARLTAFLGTVPDYVTGDIKGVKLSGVKKGGPAELAGVKGGDIITELGGRKIENIYDYTYAIEGLKIGETTTIVVQRDGQPVELKVTPTPRE
jgi:hypothetical protein